MLLIDQRVGSKDLLKPLLAAGLPAELAMLDSADLAFIGKGVKGASLDIGIELKRLDGTSTDLTQSLQSGRLSGEQLPKMLGPNGAYDYGFLLIEGTWRHNDAGQITVYHGPKLGWVPIRGGMTASELEKRVLTLELCGGMHVRHTNSRRDTVRYIASLYHWFCDRAMDEHTSHLAHHNPSTILRLSQFRQTVMTLPGIGHKLSFEVERAFDGNIGKAFSASIATWRKIPGIGIKSASKIVSTIHGG